MKIGLLSDTHGQVRRMKAALDVFAARGVQAIVHCGDLGSAACVEMLAGVAPAYAVAGNMDRHVEDLEAAARHSGASFAWEVVEVPLDDGRRLVATHGSDERVLGGLIAGQQFPYVCHGHSHRPRDQRVGCARIINPGALHRARPHTIAVLDTTADTVEHIVIP
jgi:hypothetical protein